ncbi:hypothetical protein [Nostoc sp. 'Peltigera malacea cyanobiont' DB3992]|uniref:hypothetical protein n=1 Tax=Nostoc sp. 'Peltigera malacea cyanobiont' DB3992 TaxID=1206980 RepID=UPI00211EBBF6|nr:hypothetical protein [Nostoc sp. 'Peltigera malacea cyanobiont' DB3992]
MATSTSAYRITDLFAERARNLAPPTYGTELTKIVSVSFTYGLADPILFPHTDLAAASAAVLTEEAPIALNYGHLHINYMSKLFSAYKLKESLPIAIA